MSSMFATRRGRGGEIPSRFPPVRFDLKVLRGRGLASKDEASCDPYCVVLMDEEELGRTGVVHGTRDPVWTSGNSFEEIEAAQTSAVTVRVMSEEKVVGEVRLVVGDWVTSRRGEVCSPNRWFEVASADRGRSGEIELRVLLEREKARPHRECGENDPRKVLREGAKPNSMRRLSATDETPLFAEFVWGQSESEVVERIANATTPVLLHIYDVGHSSWIANLNSTTAALGAGVFHGGVEVHGREFSFGGCRRPGQCGIFPCKPRGCVLHTYRESIYLGDCALSRSHVSSILKQMRDDWPGLGYDMLRNNCCHFCNELTIELGVGEIPAWTRRLAYVGAALHDAIGRPKQTPPPDPTPGDGSGPSPSAQAKTTTSRRQSPRQQDEREQRESEEIQGHLLEHVMAGRIQTIARGRSQRRISSARDTLTSRDTLASLAGRDSFAPSPRVISPRAVRIEPLVNTDIAHAKKKPNKRSVFFA
mmetsp:Transcript_5500/g.16628  ORF Transcript_5500/g.16628 Transcript_5500/m.16628 type:complete len:477 (-) Transcript_5500:439-1869(-)